MAAAWEWTMSALIITFMASNWLFGPLQTGDIEVRLNTAYTEGHADSGRASIEHQSAEFMAGISMGLNDTWTLAFDLPYEFSRQSYDGRVFLDRNRLKTSRIRLDYLLRPNTQVGLIGRITQPDGLESSRDALDPIRPYFKDNSDETSAAIGLRHMSQFSTTRVGVDCHVDYFATSGQMGIELDTVGLWQPGLSWLALGGAIKAAYSGLDARPNTVRIGLIERLGTAKGWAFQFTLSRDVYTSASHPDSQVIGSVSWRG